MPVAEESMRWNEAEVQTLYRAECRVHLPGW